MDKVEDAVRYVERICEPSKMSPKDAYDFLGDVVAQLEMSIEALKEENDFE